MPIEAKEMATQLKAALDDCIMLKKTIGSELFAKLSGEEIKALYKKALEFGREDEKKTLMDAGLKTTEVTYFLMRQYEQLIGTPNSKNRKRKG